MSFAPSSDPNEVAIEVGSDRFEGWQTVSVSRSCETMPNNFQLTATEALQGEALAGTRSGQSCKIYIGQDLVITGWIDRRSISIDAHNHQVTLSGRGITRNLVDCSIDILNDPLLKGSGTLTASNTLDLAQKLSRAYGVTCVSAVADLGKPLYPLTVNRGETPYQLIESVASYTGYLVYEDVYGRLVLDRVGTRQMASGFTLSGNIEAIAAERSADQRYSDYLAVWSSVDQLTQLYPLGNQRAHVTDPTLGEYRLKVDVSPQVTPDGEFGEKFVNWQKARYIGRSQAAQITCDSWRDSNNQLWTPNWLATINAPAADISNANWIIGSVTFRKDMSGTHADLVLMPPEAFDPEPNPLNLWDRQLAQDPHTQNPAPPSASRAA